jgi:hypothetical protein
VSPLIRSLGRLYDAEDIIPSLSLGHSADMMILLLSASRLTKIVLDRDSARESNLPGRQILQKDAIDPVSAGKGNFDKKISELKRMRQDEMLCYFSRRTRNSTAL